MATSVIIILIMLPASIVGDCGDVNDDGDINILDIVYLINYRYKGGAEPDCGPTGTVTDIDGNIYLTIKIGEQWWMMENLKVTHYRNGDPILYEPDDYSWTAITIGAYCEYNNDVAYGDAYGRLYNWYAVGDSRNIAPEGWHVPTDDEWKQLEMYLGMSQATADGTLWRGVNEGGKLKETGTMHWLDPNYAATNVYGFTALPGGSRHYMTGYFSFLGAGSPFWLATEYDGGSAWMRNLANNHGDIYRNYTSKSQGFAVRCVKD